VSELRLPTESEPVTLLHGDCLAWLPRLPEASVDSIVTDPPAGIEFMGKEWDTFRGDSRQPDDPTFHRSGAGPFDRAKVRHGTSAGYGHASPRTVFIDFLRAVMAECLRVLKPGGHALVWAIPRTSHWTATAIEDAGFEVRDRISHLFGSGFPKSHNLEGEWDGWGTALKPACEDWWLCRKPLAGSVAANVQRYGTGALNIDGCRVGTDAGWSYPNGRGGSFPHSDDAFGAGPLVSEPCKATAGRWPANVTLSWPADEYELRSDLTSEQRKAVLAWLHENA
jgi:hypothetical protein